MIAIARVDDTRSIPDGHGGQLVVPDIKIPQSIKWRAYALRGVPAFIMEFERESGGPSVTTLWHGPHVIGTKTHYIIDAPKAVLQKLRNQLGAANVAPLVKALRAKPGLRAWAKDQGLALVRNGAGKVVGVFPPLVIGDNNPIDLDGEDPEEAEEIPGLE